MAQCISMGTRKRITTPIHYMYISDTIWVPCIPVRTRNCANTLIHILYNFRTIWVQCISMRTQTCTNVLVHFLYIFYTIWVYVLRAIDRFALSIDGAAPSTDLLFAQASIDSAAIDGSRCAIDRWPHAADQPLLIVLWWYIWSLVIALHQLMLISARR